MTIWRLRTEVDDRPGRLAALTRALADIGGNILTMHVQVDNSGVVDEFVVETPPHVTVDTIGAALFAAGGRGLATVPATRHELVDEPTRALLLAARLHHDPRALPDLLAELLRADGGGWVYGTAAAEPSAGATLVVPVGPGRAVRLTRATLPFTLTEAARAEAFVRFLLPVGTVAAPTIAVRDGTTLAVRPLAAADLDEVQALHRRCSAETRRARYFLPRRQITGRMWRAFLDPAWGATYAVERGERIVALAHLALTPDPGVAEFAILVEDGWQGRGIGRALCRFVVAEARERGLVELRASVLGDNARMLRLLDDLGATLRPGSPVVEARIPVAVAARAHQPTPATR